MSVFNSLGSNYDLSFALKALFSNKDCNLKEYLEEKYGGEINLLFKGREAITLALKLLNFPKNSKIAINGFTCYAVYKAVEEAGCKPVLIDIPKDDLNFTRSDLVSILTNNSNIKAVIVQNTLGYPCDIGGISEICKEKNIILIEDLAHSVGARYENGKEAGKKGDFAILSFSQDKIIDGISGGALISKNGKWKMVNGKWNNPSFVRQIRDRLYPILTWKIRITYDFGVGKILHYILKSVNLLSTPMDGSLYGFLKLPNFYQNLAQAAFTNLETDLSHRRKIANIYKKNLEKKIMFGKLNSQVDNSSNLRFPIFVNNREDLMEHLEAKGFYISDIWYDAPIAPKRFMKKINYNNDCPNAEKISNTILNLPTHRNISEKQALHLSQLINTWLK